MAEINNFEITDDTFKKILEKKEQMGFTSKSWDEWFGEVLGLESKDRSTNDIIEKILKKNNYKAYYDNWIHNFALNLENIWNDRSARDILAKSDSNESKSAIVIGRGPSLIKNNHLELLAKSDYRGKIICSDGVLPLVLKSGINPEEYEDFFVITIDSQDHQKKFYENEIVIKNGYKIKGIFSTTISPEVYHAAKKAKIEVYWIHTLVDYDKGNSSFNYISGIMTKSKNHKKGLPAIQTGGNAGTSSWVIAWSILKCSTVCLIGIDMGYPLDMKFEEGIDHKFPKVIAETEAFKKAYPIIYNPEFKCECRQDPVFQYYSNALKEFIKKTSNKVKTINATEGGTLFGDGIECTTFRNFLENYSK